MLLEDITKQRRSRISRFGSWCVSQSRRRRTSSWWASIGEGDFNATGEADTGTKDVFREETRRQLCLALCSYALIHDVEKRAVLDETRRIGASLNSLLEQILIPTHHKISVVTKSGCVTVGNDKLSIAILEGGSVPDGFEEHAGEALGII